MYCRNCGSKIDDNSAYCTRCGARIDDIVHPNDSDEGSSVWFAVLGFFIPIVGFILFLVYEGKKPKRAKAAGKGALIGFITKIALSIILTILYVIFASSIFNTFVNKNDITVPKISSVFQEESTDEILKKYMDVSFGEFRVSGDKYLPETSLEVTVKNKSKKQLSFYITIEAVDKTGKRIGTDEVDVEDLNPGQNVTLTAFEFVDEEMIPKLEKATFQVLKVEKYDY